MLGVRHELQTHGFKIHEQRVGRRVVGPSRLAVKVSRIDVLGSEVTAVKHQITANFAYAARTQAAQHQPEVFQRHPRVAVALEYEIADEHITLQQTGGVDLGCPLIRRAELVERGKGSEQLDGGCGVQRALVSDCDERSFGSDVLDVDADTRFRNAGLCQRLCYREWQPRYM